MLLLSADFFKTNFFEKFFQEYNKSVKRFGSRLDWAQGYKTFSMLNSTEHKIYPAQKG